GRGGFIDSVLTAVDGFYGTVLQQLRPWSAKAPQLPSGGRSAAEEAGIDVTPPPEDLLEAAEEQLTAPVPSDGDQPPGFVLDAVKAALNDVKPVQTSEAPDAVAEPAGGSGDNSTAEMVTWDDAQERLEQERFSTSPGEGATAG
ncbi:MAG: hypothetical protein ACLGI3_05675, partial [Actinomycetes bacterium]